MPTNTTKPNGTEAPRRSDLTGYFEGAQGFLFILIALVGTGFGLAFTQQGLDIVKSVAGNAHDPAAIGRLAWLCAATSLLGFQAWLWARYCVEEQKGARGQWRGNPLLVWTPRLFAAIPFAFLISAFLRAETGLPPEADRSTWAAWILAGLGALLVAFVIFREDLTRRLRRRSARVRALGRRREAGAIDASLDHLRTIVLTAGLAAAAGFLVLFSLDPVRPALVFGPCAIVLLAMSLIIPVMATLIQTGRKVGVRASEAVLILVLVSSSVADNHAVRLTAPIAADRRPSVPQAYAVWRGQAAVAADGTRPIIFVASAGGASRSGFWTGEVLSRLEDLSNGQFSSHTFAISSVSGGSLGAAGFLATLADAPPRGQLALRTGDFTGRDYLSPAFAGQFFPDLVQRFIPIAFLPDRAEALERGWEDGWRRQCSGAGGDAVSHPPCGDPDRLRRDFLSSWRGSRGWTPQLMINGVHEETGAPILTSTVRFAGFVTADDFHQLTGHDVRVSTAIANGARFPFISPGGTYDDPAGARLGHIVDGGYFDAAGVATVRELAARMFAKIPAASSDRLQPIYLIIANGDLGAVPMKPADFAPDLFGPLRGLYAVRSAHGALLSRYLDGNPPHPPDYVAAGPAAGPNPCSQSPDPLPSNVVLICLCKPGAPMDWILSRWSQQFMRDQIGRPGADLCGNYARLAALAQRLQTRAGAP